MGGSLAGHTSDSENGGGQNSGQRIRQDVGANRLPLGGTQRQRTLPKTFRHGFERLLTDAVITTGSTMNASVNHPASKDTFQSR